MDDLLTETPENSLNIRNVKNDASFVFLWFWFQRSNIGIIQSSVFCK